MHRLLSNHRCTSVQAQGWSGIRNGDLLQRAYPTSSMKTISTFWSAVASVARHRFELRPLFFSQSAVAAALLRRTPKIGLLIDSPPTPAPTESVSLSHTPHRL